MGPDTYMSHFICCWVRGAERNSNSSAVPDWFYRVKSCTLFGFQDYCRAVVRCVCSQAAHSRQVNCKAGGCMVCRLGPDRNGHRCSEGILTCQENISVSQFRHKCGLDTSCSVSNCGIMNEEEKYSIGWLIIQEKEMLCTILCVNQ